MAPEIFMNQPYSTKADVYSFAIVLWQIVTRRPPYQQILHPSAIMRYVSVENGRPDMRLVADPECPPALVELMKRCWEQNPENRPDFKEIIHSLGTILIQNKL